MSNNKRERRAARREQYEAEARGRIYEHQTAEQMRLKRVQMFQHAVARQKQEEARTRPNPFHWSAPVLRRAPKLADKAFEFAFRLMSENLPWVRPIDDWRPKGKSATTQLKSLMRHLLVKYPTPEFLYDAVLDNDNQELQSLGGKLLKYLGQGGSMYAAVTAKSVAPGVFAPAMVPVPFTKKMCHEFVTTTAEFNLFEAIRRAQILSFGGDTRLVKTICKTPLCRRLDASQEAFWASVLQWLCNQPMLAMSQVAPILDWLRHAYGQALADGKNFTMKGKTAVSVLREVERWHGEIAKAKMLGNEVFPPSGFTPFYEEHMARYQGTGAPYLKTWAIIEIHSTKELLAEGKGLRHCVYSYTHDVRHERSSIWGLRIDGERTLTIEVDRRTRQVVQIRGLRNRMPVEGELVYIRRWATANGLTVRY